MNIHETQNTVTFSSFKNKQQLIQGLSCKIGDTFTINGLTQKINSDFINFICKNSRNSKHNSFGPYVFKKDIEVYNNKRNKDIFKDILHWAKNKGILEKGDLKTQSLKLFEEAGELSKAVVNDDRDEIIDAIGDIVVVLTSVAYFIDTDIQSCIQSAYDEIKDRKGKMLNGSFVKNK